MLLNLSAIENPKIGLNQANFKLLETDITNQEFKYHPAGIVCI